MGECVDGWLDAWMDVDILWAARALRGDGGGDGGLLLRSRERHTHTHTRTHAHTHTQRYTQTHRHIPQTVRAGVARCEFVR